MKVSTNFRAGMGQAMDVLMPEENQPFGRAFNRSRSSSYTASYGESGSSFSSWVQDAIAQQISREAAPKVLTVESQRLYEIDALRGISLVIMVGLHMAITWLKVFSGHLNAIFMQAWFAWLRPLCVTTLCLPVMAGAVFAAPFTHPKLAELRNEGSLPAKTAFFGVQLLTIAWLFEWALKTGVNSIPFILLSGVSLAVSASRAQARGNPHPFNYYLNRGIMLLTSGLFLTALSAWMMPANLTIIFNVLHLLGVGTILAYPFLNQPAWVSLTAGLGIVGATPLLAQIPFLANLGWLSSWLITKVGWDFAPLFPWMGALLLGVSAGQALYPEGERSFKLPDLSKNPLVQHLSGWSRNSLAIYLAQAPIAFAGAAAAAAI